jgi:hypothetical protein
MTRDELTKRYEGLRDFVAGQPGSALPHGLGILLQEGLLPWCMTQVVAPEKLNAASDRECDGAVVCPVPVVGLLASMVLNILPRGGTPT